MNKNFLNNNIRFGIFLLIAFLVLSVFSVNSASARDLMGGPHREIIIENRMHMDRD